MKLIWALKQINECTLTAIPGDKDSGCVLIHVCDVSALHEEILDGKGFNEITSRDVSFESVSKSLWKWATSVSIHEKTADLKKELLLDSARFGVEAVFAQLQSNLKTHKPPGQVKLRATHSTTRISLVPVGEYVAWKLRRIISLERHMANHRIER